jgi:lipid-A-disaccharide synthase
MGGMPPRIFVSAGEPSGDLHAARVVEALRRRWPDAVIDAFGGPALRAAGASIRYPMESYTVLGFFETLTKLVPHLRLLRDLGAEFARDRYDLALLVDYPGFNLRLAEAARRAGVRTLYYIAPQLWAWRPGRAQRFAAAVDRMAVILPFEPAFFASVGVEAEFVGHPLVERHWPSREEARVGLGIPASERVLALCPGSRGQEITRIWPVFRDAARRLLDEGACDRVLVAGTPAGVYPDGGHVTVHRGEAARILAAADAALVKSGTTTLEAAMTGTPMVVAYRVHPVTAAIAKRVMTVHHVSLVNLVGEREVVPELLQDAATADALAERVRPLLDPTGPAAQAQRSGLAEVRERLGRPGAAERVAAIAAELLG